MTMAAARLYPSCFSPGLSAGCRRTGSDAPDDSGAAGPLLMLWIPYSMKALGQLRGGPQETIADTPNDTGSDEYADCP